jgi:hypothetical protein
MAGRCACPTGQNLCSGACVNLQTSNQHCGVCGNLCAGAGVSCMAGRCACATGQTLCSGRCVNTQTDTANCGACGTACNRLQRCLMGACR